MHLGTRPCSARCLALLLLCALERGLSARGRVDLPDSEAGPVEGAELTELNGTEANGTARGPAPAERPGGASESRALVARAAGSPAEAWPPPPALVAVGRSGTFRASLKALTASLAYSVAGAASNFAGHVSDQTAIASGVLAMAGKTVSSSLIDFIGWGGIAAAGWSAVDAAAGILTVEGSCRKSVQGAKLVLSLGGLGVSIASMTCLGATGGALAGFAVGAADVLWMGLEPALDKWCASGEEDDDVEATFQAGYGLDSEEKVKEYMSHLLKVQIGGCSNDDYSLTPEAADARYKPTKMGFVDLTLGGMDRVAACALEVLEHTAVSIFDYVDLYCASPYD